MVFDRFHAVKPMNDRAESLRGGVFRNAPQDQKDIIRGSRRLLLKNAENLDGFVASGRGLAGRWI
jgi:hypothetical protein